MTSTAQSAEELAQVFDLTPEDYPQVHIERDFLYPDYQAFRDFKHLFPNMEMMRPETIDTGCMKKVDRQQISPNPTKVNCIDCRDFAVTMHNRLARMLRFLVHDRLYYDGDERIETQLFAMIASHEEHAARFAQPWQMPA